MQPIRKEKPDWVLQLPAYQSPAFKTYMFWNNSVSIIFSPYALHELPSKLLIIHCVLVVCGAVECAVQKNTPTMNFLNIGAGARGLNREERRWPVLRTVMQATGTAGLVLCLRTPCYLLMHAEIFRRHREIRLPERGIFRLMTVTKHWAFFILRSAGRWYSKHSLPGWTETGSINYNNISSVSSADYAFIVSLFKPVPGRWRRGELSWGQYKIIHRKGG